MDNLVIALPLLPLMAATLMGIRQLFGHANERLTAQLSLWVFALITFISIGLLVAEFLNQTSGFAHLGSWLKSGDLAIEINLINNGFRMQVTAICALLMLIIVRFSVTQLQGEQGFRRYFLILHLFAAAIFLMTLSDHLLLFFMGWHTASLCAYGLMTYAYTQSIVATHATRVLLTHCLGDTCLLLGIGLSYSWLGSATISEMTPMMPDLALDEVMALSLCFALSAAVRSAQFPFTAWMAKAMEGPAAGSAAFFGSMFIHSGVFLLIAVRAILEQSPVTMLLLIVLGALTALYSWIVSLTQTDFKSALSFHITGQLGLMFIACGLGWWSVAAIHALVHALLRSYQLLNAPHFLQYIQLTTARPFNLKPTKLRAVYVTSLQRFWLDPFIDWLIVNPLLRLGKDLSYFDDHIVNTLMGTPTPVNALATLAQLEELRQEQIETESEQFAKGSGLIGALAGRTALLLQWFEERILLRGLHKGIVYYGRQTGKMAMQVEQLLLRPRYLSLFVFITLLVVF